MALFAVKRHLQERGADGPRLPLQGSDIRGWFSLNHEKLEDTTGTPAGQVQTPVQAGPRFCYYAHFVQNQGESK